jgi:rifampicin phosphotransferase
MTMDAIPFVVPLSSLDDPRAGGKAEKLGRLIRAGLRVPDGFVVIGASPGRLPEGLLDAYASLGGPVAVRSSAIGEDGESASFAGQYDTFLGVEGASAVAAAVERCIASAHGKRAEAYRGAMRAGAGATGPQAAPDPGAPEGSFMAVVVQRMVSPRAAGVLFTADPVTGARRVVIEATPGLGEALVSGHTAVDRFVATREGAILSSELRGAEGCIDAAVIEGLVRDALRAEAELGAALDMEWAVDDTGAIHWLQARPITTLDLPGLDELDTLIDNIEGHMFTTYNTAEVLPGAVTPLGWSSVGQRVDDAIRGLFNGFGVPGGVLAGEPVVACFYGRLFLNMNAMYMLALHVAGASKENMDFSIAGRLLPKVELGPPASMPMRIINGARYFNMLFKARRRLERFISATASFSVQQGGDAAEIYRSIDAAVPVTIEAWAVHIHTSSLSGALYGVLLGILSGGKAQTPEHHAAASGLLAFIESRERGIETSSLALPGAIDRLVAAIAADEGAAASFTAMKSDRALLWLKGGAPEAIRRAFEGFLRDHGHRCVLEGEVRQPDWREDPRPLVASLQRAVTAPRGNAPPRARDAGALLSGIPRAKRRIIEWLVPRVKDAVVLRERSKSHAVRVTRALRPAYLALAERLVSAGKLPDVDAIFFFTHGELARLIEGRDPALVRRALHRRRLHPQKAALDFPRVSIGKPRPIDTSGEGAGEGDQMHGTPVSRGVAIGRARVARTIEEADAIEPGEILIVPFTDVGWTPYFMRAAGLATEIGGTLSHGAVVAREVGLPAVVNLPGATRRFRTGDMLRLDGTTGEVRRLR